MKILLCLSKTPDTTAKIKFTPDGKSLDETNIQYVINPNDDHALAHAAELKSSNNAEITVVHVGEASSEAVIRKALAIGADKAIRVNSKPHDAYYVAYQIAEVYKNGDYDLIMTGCESIDFNGSQVCSLLGGFLNIPAFNEVTSLSFENDQATLTCDIDGGEQTVALPLPLVAGVNKEIAEPKIPNMRGIMMARKKPLETIEPAESEAPVETVTFEPPKEKAECRYIDPDNAGELIELLQNEAKVI